MFFFNDTATTEIYTLSLHDALPISRQHRPGQAALGQALPILSRQSGLPRRCPTAAALAVSARVCLRRSEEHTSELQSRQYLVCRLLLEKKKIYMLLTITNLNQIILH